MRDPDGYIYFKEEVGGFVMGGFEPDAKPWGMDGIPADFEFQLLPDDWDQFEPLLTNAIHRVPALETAPIKLFLNGPESFTPDNNFLLGPAPECAGVFVAAGFNSMGIASAGGAGRALAEWIVAGEAQDDLWAVDIRRFARFNANPSWLRDRVKEVLGLHYAMPWPNRELATARPFRRSPLYDRLAAKGAVFGSKMGWERPNFFAGEAGAREIAYSFGPQNWADAAAAEHRAVRETAGLVDMSSFAKLLVQGRDAEGVLQRICAGDVAIPVGSSVYTPLLNRRGGLESDVTVARLAPDAFLLVTGSAQATRDGDWVRRHIPDEARAVVTDVTSAYAVLALMGPRAPEILARVSRAPLGAVPFGGIVEADIGYATCSAMRRSYMGEAGFELFVPTEFAAAVYETLFAAGADLGLRDVGYYAVESLRLEKAYRAWGRELGPNINPFQAGLGFAIRLNKPDFIGRDALVAARTQPLSRRIVAFTGPAPARQLAWGGESILAGGRPVGEVTSAAYGATLGGIVALGLVSSAGEPMDQAWLDQRRFEIDIAGEVAPMRASLKAFYDPDGLRMRAA
jgi:4-methylaminobutanoate oxidase (formaldehyde-forming)